MTDARIPSIGLEAQGIETGATLHWNLVTAQLVEAALACGEGTLSADGPVVVPIAGPIRADNGDIIRLAALAGAGVLFQPRFIVGDDLDAGTLVRVLPDWQSAELGVYAVYPSRKHLSAKVRTFVDFLAAAIRP